MKRPNNDYTLCINSGQRPSTKLKINDSEKNHDSILTYFQTKVSEKEVYKHVNSPLLLAKKRVVVFFLENFTSIV